jgi:hypothetical protein
MLPSCWRLISAATVLKIVVGGGFDIMIDEGLDQEQQWRLHWARGRGKS